MNHRIARIFLLALFFAGASFAAPKMGTMTDSRDGKKYKTVKIGEQVWMAENLNYKKDYSLCHEYGCLYIWESALRACPSGWHLPTNSEWEELFNFLHVEKVCKDGCQYSGAGKKLKSTSGWDLDGNGKNDYGFSALPAGLHDSKYGLLLFGSSAKFWSATKSALDFAYYMGLAGHSDDGFLDCDDGYANLLCDDESGRTGRIYDKLDAMSVRCLQGDDNEDVPVESKDDKTETIYYKALVDKRDGKEYKILEIGNQTWMAENLNYKMEDSYCYDDNESNCSKYGRLYKWRTALKACPAGWHLPSKAEYKTLLDAVGGKPAAGKNLKSVSNNGDDTIGFSALLAGTMSSNGSFLNEGFITNFWSSTENNSNRAYALNLSYNGGKADLSFFDKEFGVSIRCLEDSP